MSMPQNAAQRNTPAVIDAATPKHAPTTDQLGFLRPQGKGFDIGTLEYR